MFARKLSFTVHDSPTDDRAETRCVVENRLSNQERTFVCIFVKHLQLLESFDHTRLKHLNTKQYHNMCKGKAAVIVCVMSITDCM